MKKIFILVVSILATAVFTGVSAQVAPPGSGDKNLRDTDVKGRSNELERIDREAGKDAAKKKDKSGVNPAAEQPEDKLAAKYAEIKTDFEQIQQSQDSIINAYKSGGKINYTQIGKFSMEINKSAIRLNSNLFAPIVAENSTAKKEKKTETEAKTPKTIRDIIVDLDNTIASFAASSMFQNLRVVDAAVSEKTRLDLERIIELSELLNTEAVKMAAGKQK